jgi:hypothetical protein
MNTDDRSNQTFDFARAQVHALLAMASTVDRLAEAVEAHGQAASA